MQLEAGTIIAGKYRLERPLSQGGMGSLWVAQHLQLVTHVAVKFMATAYAEDPAFRARFEREARAAAHLRSPHVVQVHDFGFENGVPYLVMELLRGEDLGARLGRHGRLSLGETLRILVQAGKALRSVHEAGLVHRDLKPANLFLARVDGEDEDLVKLLDFGIAKDTRGQLAGEASTTGEVMGSPHYMSPEQLRAERDVDARTDLWALGVILFRMVTGSLPFPGDVIGHVVTRILVDPIPSARQLAPDLPPLADAFFARAMARDRTYRFQSVREMVDAFARLAGVPAFSSSVDGVSSPFARGPEGAVAFAGTPVLSATPFNAGASSPPFQPPAGGGYAGPGATDGPSGTLTNPVHVQLDASSSSTSRRPPATWIVAGVAALALAVLGAGTVAYVALNTHSSTPEPDASAATEANAAAVDTVPAIVPAGEPAAPPAESAAATPPSRATNAQDLMSGSAAMVPSSSAPGARAEPPPPAKRVSATTAPTAPSASVPGRASKPASSGRAPGPASAKHGPSSAEPRWGL